MFGPKVQPTLTITQVEDEAWRTELRRGDKRYTPESEVRNTIDIACAIKYVKIVALRGEEEIKKTTTYCLRSTYAVSKPLHYSTLS